MAVYLVRHAHAGHRHGFAGPDEQRPISEQGAGQAQFLVGLLGDHPIKAVLSSRAARCVQTVEPLARRLGLSVEIAPELFEGADPTAAIDLCRSHAERDVVLCSHGDLIPDVVRRLAAMGMTYEGGGWDKGSTWALHSDGERFATATYTPNLGRPG